MRRVFFGFYAAAGRRRSLGSGGAIVGVEAELDPGSGDGGWGCCGLPVCVTLGCMHEESQSVVTCVMFPVVGLHLSCGRMFLK